MYTYLCVCSWSCYILYIRLNEGEKNTLVLVGFVCLFYHSHLGFLVSRVRVGKLDCSVSTYFLLLIMHIKENSWLCLRNRRFSAMNGLRGTEINQDVGDWLTDLFNEPCQDTYFTQRDGCRRSRESDGLGSKPMDIAIYAKNCVSIGFAEVRWRNGKHQHDLASFVFSFFYFVFSSYSHPQIIVCSWSTRSENLSLDEYR